MRDECINIDTSSMEDNYLTYDLYMIIYFIIRHIINPLLIHTMKTLTQTIYTLFFALALFISVPMVSSAAGQFELSSSFTPNTIGGSGQFDQNPAGGSTQFLSIKSGNACSNCANQNNSVSVNIPNPGDTDRFTVYMDFRNEGNATIYNAEGKMNLPSSGGTISGTLSGQGASSISDTVFLTNLPNDYDIDFVSGYVENTHGSTDPQACAGYNQNFSISGSQVLGGGVPLGDLDTVYNGWCDQGYLIATFEIENTGMVIGDPELEIQTNNASNINANYAQLNGEVEEGNNAQVWFTFSSSYSNLNCESQSGQVNVGGTYDAGEAFFALKSGLQSDTTYYFQACGQDQINGPIESGEVRSFTTDEEEGSLEIPDAETENADNEDEDSAELNGRIRMNDVNNGIVFFVYGQDEDQIDDTENNYDSYGEVENNEDEDEYMVVMVDDENDDDQWRSYSEDVDDLEEGEEYFFRICVGYDDFNGNETLECGNTKDFDTDSEEDDNDGDVEIRTDNPRSVTRTTAEMCGDLLDDGGENRETYIEFRRSNGGSFSQTPERQRDEGFFCERVSGLQPATSYSYRACAEGECGGERTFRTVGTVVQNLEPIVVTQIATNIRSNYALLRGTYVSYADRATVWFNYGRTQGLGSETRRQNVSGSYGVYTHPFTNLAANTTYYYQAAIQTVNGFDTGAVYSFRTNGGGVIIPQPPVVVVEDDDTDIDLSSLGLGLSLIRLDIDDEEDVIVRDEQLTYDVEWENISELDLFDLNLKVVFPPEIQITNVSRGRFDQKTNTLYYTIDELLPGEEDRLSINAVVGPGTIGTLVTAEAEIAYDNPVNDAQENAKDFDLNEYGAQFAGVTASIFGLGNITFLGWLVILLGLFIIFLIARWLYLQREEMRAQAYASGYRPYVSGPGYDAYGQPVAQMPVYQQPPYDVPPAGTAPQADDSYEPYRPNRG